MKLATIENKEIHNETTYYILTSFPKQGNGTTYKNIFTQERNARSRARALLRENPRIDSIVLRRESVYLRTSDAEISSSHPCDTITRENIAKNI